MGYMACFLSASTIKPASRGWYKEDIQSFQIFVFELAAEPVGYVHQRVRKAHM